MRRRDFLRATLASAGLAILGVGCDDDPQASAGNISDTVGGGDTGGGDTIGGGDTSGANNPNNNPNNTVMGSPYFPQSIASGDPKPNSVVFWTRVEDEDAVDVDIELSFEMATDAEFTQQISLNDASFLTVVAEARFDHCVKVRVTDLSPATTYFYRFVYKRSDAEVLRTNIGKTLTAPAEDADVSVRFAMASCQDYIGRFYNSYARMLQEGNIDFLVFLGDYIYESTGDPRFQSADGRQITFRHPEDAIVINPGTEGEFHAARSLDNYRDLYRTYRSDRQLQTAHETIPIIAIWDDHEFADDAHGDTSTHFNGRVDEADIERRKNANQAWFEYMPVDYMDENFVYDPAVAFPGDIKIYRDFHFGKHVHLVMTDLRTWRADHLVPEESFPGTVIMDEATLLAEHGSIPPSAEPYFDVDVFDGGSYITPLQTIVTPMGVAPEAIGGLLSVAYINSLLEGDSPELMIDLDANPDLPMGFSWATLGKSAPFSSIGSRFLVIKDPYDIYARYHYGVTNGASEACMGDEQEAWFLDTMKSSTATWKLWGNEFCLSETIVDLSGLSAALGPAFAQKFYLNAEDWSSIPNRRDVIMAELTGLSNVVALTGDLHSFIAATPRREQAPEEKIVEFVVAGISSGPFKKALIKTAGSLDNPQAIALAATIDQFLLDKNTKPNPHMAYIDPDAHGFAIIEASVDTLSATYHSIEGKHVSEDLTADPAALDANFNVLKFKTETGGHELFHEIDGAWLRWDIETLEWV